MILIEIAEGPVHGYAIAQRIKQKHGTAPGHSTLYPMLMHLEEDGLIDSSWVLYGKRPKKTYTLTKRGQKALGRTTEILTVLRMDLTSCLVEVST